MRKIDKKVMSMSSKSKHQSALDELSKSFSSFLRIFINDLLSCVSEKEHNAQIHTKFMHLAVLSSAQQLRHLKIKLSQETSKDEDESYERLSLLCGDICSSTIEPKMITALEYFKDAFPKYLKQIMCRSGFHTLEVEEIHPSYISVYSSFIVSYIVILDGLKSTCSQPPHTHTSFLPQRGSVSESQSNNNETIELIKRTRKHCIYRDKCNNAAIKVLISDTPSMKEVENLENEFNVSKLIMHPSFRLSFAKTIFESIKALTLE